MRPGATTAGATSSVPRSGRGWSLARGSSRSSCRVAGGAVGRRAVRAGDHRRRRRRGARATRSAWHRRRARGSRRARRLAGGRARRLRASSSNARRAMASRLWTHWEGTDPDVLDDQGRFVASDQGRIAWARDGLLLQSEDEREVTDTTTIEGEVVTARYSPDGEELALLRQVERDRTLGRGSSCPARAGLAGGGQIVTRPDGDGDVLGWSVAGGAAGRAGFGRRAIATTPGSGPARAASSSTCGLNTRTPVQLADHQRDGRGAVQQIDDQRRRRWRGARWRSACPLSSRTRSRRWC